MSSIADRFAEAVRHRREEELHLSQMEVWRAGGPSNTLLTSIENGRLSKLTNATARKLDAGLQWVPGSARRTWEGGEPKPLGVDAEAEIRALKLPPEAEAKILAVLEADRAARDAERRLG